MSTNKTENCHLHAWEAGDDFLRTEINENFAAIDTAVATMEGVLPSNKALRIVTGTYTGSGVNRTNTILLPFRPKAVFVACSPNQYNPHYAFLLNGRVSDYGSITDQGFQVSGKVNHSLNESGEGGMPGNTMNPHSYIAFGWSEE